MSVSVTSGVANYVPTTSALARSVAAIMGVGDYGVVAGAWSPALLFLAGEQGFAYDISNPSLLFQDAAGTIPVTAAGDPVGLVLDTSRGLATSPELVTDGSFSNGAAGWTLDAGVTIADQGGGDFEAVFTASGANTEFWRAPVQNIAAGTYRVTYTITSYTAGTFRPNIAGIVGTARSSAGTFTELVHITSVGAQRVGIRGLSASNTARVDDISIVRIEGNHSTQSVSAARPRWGRWPLSAVIAGRVRNLLIHTNDITQAAYGRTAITTPNANTMVETAASSDHVLNQSFASVVSGLAYTETVSLGKGTLATAPDFMQITMAAGRFGATQFATVNVATGAVVNTAGGATCTALGADPDNAGSFRFAYTATATSSGAGVLLVVIFCNNNPSATRSPTYVGVVTADCKVYKCQAEQSATATTYQAVGASSAWDVTEAGQPTQRFLYFDGLDDSLATGTINFTATDEMFVCAGVTKPTETTTRAVLELTAAVSANNGAVALFVPTGIASDSFLYASRGTITVQNATNNSFLAPASAVLSGLSKISTDTNTTRKDGALVANLGSDQGSGNYANAVVNIGARAGTSLFFVGNLYSLVMRGKLPTTTQLGQTEQWTARRVKGTL